jgi:hypothetical protein
MMEDPQSWGAAEPVRQSVHDLVHAIGTHLGLIPSDQPSPTPDHDKAIADMNAQTNAHKNDAANQSFIKPDQAAAIRKKAMK